MFGQKDGDAARPAMATPKDAATGPGQAGTRLLTVSGDYAKIEGTFEIADSLEVECEIGGELNVRGKLTIGQNGAVSANVRTVDAFIKGSYEGNMIATGNVEIAATGRVTGNITTDSLVISKGGFFNGNVSRIKEEDKKQSKVFLVDEEEEPAKEAAASGGRTASPRKMESGSGEGRVVQSTRNV